MYLIKVCRQLQFLKKKIYTYHFNFLTSYIFCCCTSVHTPDVPEDRKRRKIEWPRFARHNFARTFCLDMCATRDVCG